jgi:hypothetical protein
MKKSKMGWLEMGALALVGGLGAYGVTRYLSHKLRVGDMAFVPADKILITSAAQVGTINLGAFSAGGPGGPIKVTVTDLTSPEANDGRTPQGMVGQEFGVRVPVSFAPGSVVRIERDGKVVS